MAVSKSVEVEVPGGKELAELRAVLHDLKWVIEVCERLIAMLDTRLEEAVLTEALSTAALVRYMRCFSQGVRPKAPRELLDSLSDREQVRHQWFKDLRDKYVAHSVNPFEENVLTVLVPEEPTPNTQISGLGFGHSRLLLDHDLARELHALAASIASGLEDLIEVKTAEVLARVRELPIKELAERPVTTARLASWDQVARRRR